MALSPRLRDTAPMRALAMLLVLGSAVARADDEDREVARAHFLAGQGYYVQARYTEALHEFEEAYRLSRRPALLFNVGVCQEKLGRVDDAIASFSRFLVEDPNASDRASVEARIVDLRARRSAVMVVAPPPPPPRRRRAWVWGVVGGAAAVVVAGVVVGALLGTRDDTRTLPDVHGVPTSP
jgi:tetratricopeptide (TPR) repeat protein